MNVATFGNLFSLDTVIIVGVIMLIFGGKKIPEVAKSISASIREFRKGKDGDET